MDFKDRFTSRKFLLTLVGVVVILLKALGVIDASDDNIWQLIAAILGFVGVEGASDLVGRWKETKITAE